MLGRGCAYTSRNRVTLYGKRNLHIALLRLLAVVRMNAANDDHEHLNGNDRAAHDTNDATPYDTSSASTPNGHRSTCSTRNEEVFVNLQYPGDPGSSSPTPPCPE